jgi:hypothetical protein
LHGAEVVEYTGGTAAKWESLQVQAGVQILKVNAHTHRSAVRALMGVKSMQASKKAARLRYLGRVFTAEEETWHRKAFRHPKRTAKLKGPTRSQWRVEVLGLVESDDCLRTGYTELRERVDSSPGGVLARRRKGKRPEGFGEEDEEKTTCALTTWNRVVAKWEEGYELHAVNQAVLGGEHSTLRLLSRVFMDTRGGDNFCVKMSRPQICTRPNVGTDQIRLRLLSGTSSLNATKHHFADVNTEGCPMDGCDAPREDVTHFLTGCRNPAWARAKATHTLALAPCCTHPATGLTCSEAFDAFDDDESRAAFICGGPVDQFTPCGPVDGANRAFV